MRIQQSKTCSHIWLRFWQDSHIESWFMKIVHSEKRERKKEKEGEGERKVTRIEQKGFVTSYGSVSWRVHLFLSFPPSLPLFLSFILDWQYSRVCRHFFLSLPLSLTLLQNTGHFKIDFSVRTPLETKCFSLPFSLSPSFSLSDRNTKKITLKGQNQCLIIMDRKVNYESSVNSPTGSSAWEWEREKKMTISQLVSLACNWRESVCVGATVANSNNSFEKTTLKNGKKCRQFSLFLSFSLFSFSLFFFFIKVNLWQSFQKKKSRWDFNLRKKITKKKWTFLPDERN